MDYERQPDPNLASELRQGAGREWTEEAAEDERLTELHRRRRMTLTDLAKEWVNKGDRVSIEFDGHSFSGAVSVAGEDYVSIEGPGQAADVKLAEARWSILPNDAPSGRQSTGAETFKALLHEHSATDQVVRLALPSGDMAIGRLGVVADDHVEMIDVDERRLVVPMKMILAVVRSSAVQ
jgi:hypothetical protein